MAFERITIDHEKMGGLPCIRDLRIRVGTVMGQLAAGREVRDEAQMDGLVSHTLRKTVASFLDDSDVSARRSATSSATPG